MISVKFEQELLDLPKGFAQSLYTPQKPKLFGSRGQDSTKEKIQPFPLKKFKKSVWTKDEDNLLKLKVNEKGATHWAQIASFLPNRSGKQCRERWHNHLREGVTKAAWEFHEYWLLALCVRALGKKWSAISQFIPGRSDNTIKNQWNCKMKPLKEHFELKINKLLKRPQLWKSLTQDQQILLQLISQKTQNVGSPIKKSPPKFLQQYCILLETGIEQFCELKQKLSSTETSYLEIQTENHHQQFQIPGQLSAAISAGDCFFQSDQENPIMPKCLFR